MLVKISDDLIRSDLSIYTYTNELMCFIMLQIKSTSEALLNEMSICLRKI